MNNRIHPTAIIEDSVTLGQHVTVGPYCVIQGNVTIADHVTLHSHVAIAGLNGTTHIGAHTEIFPFASLGHAPQDLKYNGEEANLEVGEHNVIREHVTMNPGTQGGGSLTKVGNHNLFMTASHVAHDCMVGDHVILANNATIAGHVTVHDGAIIGGLSAVHQFVRIGAYAMIGGMSGVERDVIPFGSVTGERASLSGLNIIGMKRRELPRESIHALRAAYKKMFEEGGTLAERVEQVAQDYADIEEVQKIVRFLKRDSARSFCLPK